MNNHTKFFERLVIKHHGKHLGSNVSRIKWIKTKGNAHPWFRVYNSKGKPGMVGSFDTWAMLVKEAITDEYEQNIRMSNALYSV